MMPAHPRGRQFQNRNGAEDGTVAMLVLTLGSNFNAGEHGHCMPASIYLYKLALGTRSMLAPVGQPRI